MTELFLQYDGMCLSLDYKHHKSQFSVKVVHRNVPLTKKCLNFQANIFHDELAKKGHHFDNIDMHSICVAIVLAAVLTASDLRMSENYVISGIPKSSYCFTSAFSSSIEFDITNFEKGQFDWPLYELAFDWLGCTCKLASSI